MSIALSPAFLATSLVVALIPGTGVLYTISVSLTRKMSASVAAAIGCTLGIVPHIAACALGLSALMNAGARAFMAIRYLGAAYLLYLAWKTWVTAGELKAGEGGERDGYLKIAGKGVALNLLNPKGAMKKVERGFALAFAALAAKLAFGEK